MTSHSAGSSAAIVVACGAAVVLTVWRLARPAPPTVTRYDDRASNVFHLLMLTAMIGMAADSAAAVPNTLWCTMFGVLTGGAVCWLITVAVPAGAPDERPDRVGAAVYHVVAAVAMLYTVLRSGAGHGHGAPSAVAWALASIFVVDSVAAALFSIDAPGRFGCSRRHALVTVYPHIAMDLAMAVMLTAAPPMTMM